MWLSLISLAATHTFALSAGSVGDIYVAAIGLFSTIIAIIVTNIYNKRQRVAEPALTEAQTDHEEAQTAASFVSSAKELVELLRAQLDVYRAENSESKSLIKTQIDAYTKLMEETKNLRKAEEQCVARLSEMQHQLEQLQRQVNVLSEQVLSLGGQPQLAIL